MDDQTFECGVDWPTAYADYLVFGNQFGVHFDAAGHVQPLTSATVADILDKQQKRTRCLLSLERTDKPLDFDQLPPASAFTCYDADAYAQLLRD